MLDLLVAFLLASSVILVQGLNETIQIGVEVSDGYGRCSCGGGIVDGIFHKLNSIGRFHFYPKTLLLFNFESLTKEINPSLLEGAHARACQCIGIPALFLLCCDCITQPSFVRWHRRRDRGRSEAVVRMATVLLPRRPSMAGKRPLAGRDAVKPRSAPP